MDEKVDQFVASLTHEWQRTLCGRILEDIRASAPLDEHIKWRNPYFDHDGAAVLKWFCAKEWIIVYFFRGRELPDPDGLFEPTDNARMTTIKVTRTSDLDRNAFRRLVTEAARLAGT